MTLLARAPACLTATFRLCVASLCVVLLFRSRPAAAGNGAGDDFLAGYVAAVLERDLAWEKGSYVLTVVDGIATITLPTDDPTRREAADKNLRTIAGLRGVAIVTAPAADGGPPPGAPSGKTAGRAKAFPTGDVFRPLLADPKQPQFFVSVSRFTTESVRYTMASVGFGETFGLYRWSHGTGEGNGLQLSLEGALFAQFNLSTPSYDLVNADYTIGVPLTYRFGGGSLRFRVYHQSSHLGDELLLSPNHPERVNLSYEALELIYSHEWGGFRLYGGGEYLIHKEPADLEPLSAHWGIEYRGQKPLLWSGRPVAAVDMKSLEEHDWAVDTSVKAGLEFGRPDPGQRRLRLMAWWYKGFDPRGQFYDNEVESLGLEVSLGF